MNSNSQSKEIQVMILSAGFGTRLWPLTSRLAKPAIPFLGKALVRHCVELAEHHRFSKIVVNTHYQAQSVREALVGKSVDFSHETEILGTAGALRHALDHGLLDANRSTLIINGKLFTDIDLAAVAQTHRHFNAEITMVLRENTQQEAFREVICNNHIVSGFGKERQPEGKNPRLFTGIHIISPRVLQTIPSGCCDSIRDIYPPFIEQNQVFAHLDRSPRWWEVSTLARYLDLHALAHKQGIGPANTIADDASISPKTKLKNCIVWSKAKIDENCELEDVVLGRGVELEPGTHLKRTVVMHTTELNSIERGTVKGDYVYVPVA